MGFRFSGRGRQRSSWTIPRWRRTGIRCRRDTWRRPALGCWAGDLAVEKKKAMIEAVRSIPGVTAAGTVSRTPFTGGIHGIPIFRPGTTEFKLDNSVLATYVYQMSAGCLDPGG